MLLSQIRFNKLRHRANHNDSIVYVHIWIGTDSWSPKQLLHIYVLLILMTRTKVNLVFVMRTSNRTIYSTFCNLTFRKLGVVDTFIFKPCFENQTSSMDSSIEQTHNNVRLSRYDSLDTAALNHARDEGNIPTSSAVTAEPHLLCSSFIVPTRRPAPGVCARVGANSAVEKENTFITWEIWCTWHRHVS